MKSLRFLLSLFASFACFAGLPSASAQTGSKNLSLLGTANRLLTGSVFTVDPGATFTVSGVLSGTPTGGTLNLSAVTLTLPTVPVGQGGTGATTLTGLIRGNGTGAFTAAVAGTDFLAPNGNGSALTALNATQLTTGTVPTARLYTTAAGYAITNGAALDAFAAVATNGLLTRTAANTYAARTLTGTAGQITVTNGDGVSGNPTIALPASVAIGTTFTATAWGTGGAVDVNGTTGGILAAYFNGSPRGYLIGNTGDLAINTQGALPLLLRTNGNTAVTISSTQAATFAGNILGSGGTAPTSTTSGSNQFTAGIATSGPVFAGGIINGTATVRVTGINISDTTSTLVLDHASPVSRLISYGGSTSQQGTFNFLSLSSNGSLNTTSLGLSTTLAVFPAAVTAGGLITGTGNASTTAAMRFDNPSGAIGTAQHYANFTAGGTTISRALRGNGLAGYVSNGLNIDNFGGFQIGLNVLGGSGESFVVRTAGTTDLLTIASSGTATFSNSIRSTSATGGIGYGTGAGGTVTQLTSKATGATLSTVTGTITTAADALAAGTVVSFVFTNTAIAATDALVINHVSGGTVGAYSITYTAAAGSATIFIRNLTAGSLSEALTLRFAVIKSVNS